MPLSKTLIANNLEEAKKLIAEIEAEKPKGIAIRRLFDNSVIFQSTKQTMKDAVIEALKNGANLHGADLRGADLHGADLHGADLRGADLRGANLHGADLHGANLHGAELQDAKLYGRGGTSPLKKAQVPAFLAALGFVIRD